MVRTQAEKAVLRRSTIDRAQARFVPRSEIRASNYNVFSL